MNCSVSDLQIETLFFESHSCPDCRAVCSPVDGCHDRGAGAMWECTDEDDCGKTWTVRQLVENSLRRAGMLLQVVGPADEGHGLEPAG